MSAGLASMFIRAGRVSIGKMSDVTTDGLVDLPPSAKLVYKVLEYNGPLTQKGIVEESMLSARTVRYALERLEDISVVDEDVYFADARQNLYEISDEMSTENTEAAVCDD